MSTAFFSLTMLVKRLDSDVDDERVVGQLDDQFPMNIALDVARVNHGPVVRQLSTYSVGLLIT